ncbi:hypothetical protein [Streptomyces sp. NPDC087437]
MPSATPAPTWAATAMAHAVSLAAFLAHFDEARGGQVDEGGKGGRQRAG